MKHALLTKRWKQPELTIDPSVLVVKEKHGTWYIYVPDLETLYRRALGLLTNRLESGYWYVECLKPVSPGFTLKEVEAFPEGTIKSLALRQLKDYEETLKNWEEEAADFADLKKAVEDKNGKRAWDTLKRRSHYSYEEVALEPLSGVTK
jgi:hypothetical protein